MPFLTDGPSFSLTVTCPSCAHLSASLFPPLELLSKYLSVSLKKQFFCKNCPGDSSPEVLPSSLTLRVLVLALAVPLSQHILVYSFVITKELDQLLGALGSSSFIPFLSYIPRKLARVPSEMVLLCHVLVCLPI